MCLDDIAYVTKDQAETSVLFELIAARMSCDHGFVASMSGRGNCYHTAMVETVFKTIKSELIWRMAFATRDQASKAIGHYIEGFYNPRRRHSSLGCVGPVTFEATFRADQKEERMALHFCGASPVSEGSACWIITACHGLIRPSCLSK